jgi:5,5'-dehydrodivanillate O-demethylase oxygenase subunit
VQRGEDPMGVVRDPAKNVCIRWPNDRTARLTHAPTTDELRASLSRGPAQLRGPNDYFPFYAGQPEPVRQAFAAAMGLDRTDEAPAAEDRLGVVRT